MGWAARLCAYPFSVEDEVKVWALTVIQSHQVT